LKLQALTSKIQRNHKLQAPTRPSAAGASKYPEISDAAFVLNDSPGAKTVERHAFGFGEMKLSLTKIWSLVVEYSLVPGYLRLEVSLDVGAWNLEFYKRCGTCLDER
jgi:hypothetical protein